MYANLMMVITKILNQILKTSTNKKKLDRKTVDHTIYT